MEECEFIKGGGNTFGLLVVSVNNVVLPSIILADLFGNRSLLKQVQMVMVCDLWLVLVIVIMIVGTEKRNCEGGPVEL